VWPGRPAMSNHLHIVVLTDPNRVQGWSPAEVAPRRR